MENTVQPNKQELNLAARISVTRGIDFDQALELVLSNPETAEVTASASNATRSIGRANSIGATEIQELLRQVYVKGRSDEEQDTKISMLEEQISRFEELEESQQAQSERFDSLERVTGSMLVGFDTLLTQSDEFNSGKRQGLNTTEIRSRMLEAAKNPQLHGNVVAELEKVLSALPSSNSTQVLNLSDAVIPQSLPSSGAR
jgi:hypothetical protein